MFSGRVALPGLGSFVPEQVNGVEPQDPYKPASTCLGNPGRCLLARDHSKNVLRKFVDLIELERVHLLFIDMVYAD